MGLQEFCFHFSLNLDLIASPMSTETEDIANEGLPYLAKVKCFQINVLLKTHLSQAYRAKPHLV